MKFYVLLIIFLISSCTSNKNQAEVATLETNSVIFESEVLCTNSTLPDIGFTLAISEEERASIIAGLKQDNYSVLDPFFETNELFPAFILQDTIFINPTNNQKTELIHFKNSGEVLAYTNFAGVYFFNEKITLVDPEELSATTSIQEGSDYKTYDAYKIMFSTTNIRELDTMAGRQFSGSPRHIARLYIADILTSFLQFYIKTDDSEGKGSVINIYDYSDKDYSAREEYVKDKMFGSEDNYKQYQRSVLNAFIFSIYNNNYITNKDPQVDFNAVPLQKAFR